MYAPSQWIIYGVPWIRIFFVTSWAIRQWFSRVRKNHRWITTRVTKKSLFPTTHFLFLTWSTTQEFKCWKLFAVRRHTNKYCDVILNDCPQNVSKGAQAFCRCCQVYYHSLIIEQDYHWLECNLTIPQACIEVKLMGHFILFLYTHTTNSFIQGLLERPLNQSKRQVSENKCSLKFNGCTDLDQWCGLTWSSVNLSLALAMTTVAWWSSFLSESDPPCCNDTKTFTNMQPTLQTFDTYKQHCQTSDIRCTLLGNNIVENSDVLGASPVGTAPTTPSFLN